MNYRHVLRAFQALKALLWAVIGFYAITIGVAVLAIGGYLEQRPPALGGPTRVHILKVERWAGP